jgi:hypothetical protein
MKQMENNLVHRQNVCGSSDSSRIFQEMEVLLQYFALESAPYAPWLTSLLLAHVGHGKHPLQICMAKAYIRQSNYKWYSNFSPVDMINRGFNKLGMENLNNTQRS